MNRFPTRLFLLVVGLQIGVLSTMIVRRLHLLQTGQRVLLKCSPVDPRSLFSGDYVVLNYEISTLSAELLTDKDGRRDSFRRNETLYVALKQDQGSKFFKATAISRDLEQLKRKHAVVIRGRIENPERLRLRYGVEHYFVPQREGRAIEDHLDQVSVEVAISDSGENAIRRLFINEREISFQ